MKVSERGILATILGLAAASLSACNSAIERDWESLSVLGNGAYNTLAAYTDGTADTTIYATTSATPGVWTKFYFEGNWREVDDQFLFDFRCMKGPCNDDDFSMRCDLVDENNGETFKLDCVANGKWKNYPFNWQEVL